jgi:hypothetical protein
MQTLFATPTSTNKQQQRGFVRRSVGGSSTLFNGIMMNVNGTFSMDIICVCCIM